MTTKSLTLAVLGYGALSFAIWLHELGHSLAAYGFGCKAHWWQTDMSWYLWSSWGGNIDYQCLRTRGSWALGTTDFAGIAVNLLLLAAAPFLGCWWRSTSPSGSGASWWFIATVLLALANYAEAFSYLVVNTLWLSSDMETVVTASHISQWVWLAVGTGLAIVVAGLLAAPVRRGALALGGSPSSARTWLVVLVLYVILAGGGMAVARFTLT